MGDWFGKQFGAGMLPICELTVKRNFCSVSLSGR